MGCSLLEYSVILLNLTGFPYLPALGGHEPTVVHLARASTGAFVMRGLDVEKSRTWCGSAPLLWPW